jgi:ABC-type dipeptide/oligopeptide/nickel transport system permease component
MGTYIVQRLLHSLLVLLGITLFVFTLLHLSGDPVRLFMPPDTTPEQLEAARERLGFKDAFHVQYLRFLGRVVRADFGNSYKSAVPAVDLIREYFPNTLLLTTVGFLIAVTVAIPAGILSAIKHNTVFDFLISFVVLVGQATPLYWLGLVLIMLFAVRLGWLPSGGFGYTRELILPAATLAVFSMSRIARMCRSSMLEVLMREYVRTARSQGIREVLVNFRFAFKNAAIPIITLMGVEFCVLLEGSVVTETIFSWPGVGRLVVNAVYNRDYPVVQAVVIFITTIIVFANLGVDILYTYLDPRIKYGRNGRS